MHNKTFIYIFLSLLIASCNNNKFIITGKTMGTTYNIVTNKYIDKKIITKKLLNINTVFSTWNDNSELNKINNQPANKWLLASDNLLFLLHKSQQIHEQTDGFFDIAIGNLINIWGFGNKNINKKPTIAAIKNALNHSSMKYLTLKDNYLKKLKDIKLNLSAIAKGFAVDNIAEMLLQHNIDNFVVEIGGEVRVMGDKTIGIERINKIPITIQLHNNAIATSGDYRNYRIFNKKKFIHIINPKTGMPSNSNLISVSIIHQKTYVADAYATALLAMGKNKAIKFINKYKLQSVLIDKNNNILQLNL